MKHYLELAYNLKKIIDQDERFILLNEKEKAMENSEEVMALSYNKDLKETYLSDALKHFDKNSSEVRKARLELFHANEKLDAHPLVKDYLEAYHQVELILNEINNLLFISVKKENYHEGCRR